MRRASWTGALALAVALVAGCGGGRTVSLSDADTIRPPTFADTVPPAESPLLDAIRLRDTGGLEPTAPSADPRLVGAALDVLAAARPDVTEITDLYFDEQNVWFGIPEPGRPNIETSGYFDGARVRFSEPRYSTDIGFPLELVRPEAITALVDGLRQRFPMLTVQSPRLDVALSYDLALSWRVTLHDVRGELATVWADPNGTITAVDAD